MELVLSALGGGGLALVILVAWVVWLNKGDERRRQQQRDDVERVERSLAERIGSSPSDPV